MSKHLLLFEQPTFKPIKKPPGGYSGSLCDSGHAADLSRDLGEVNVFLPPTHSGALGMEKMSVAKSSADFFKCHRKNQVKKHFCLMKCSCCVKDTWHTVFLAWGQKHPSFYNSKAKVERHHGRF